MKNKLIYIMDAQCGWCYGNSENILSVYEEFKDDFDFEFLNGGMWIGENAPVAGNQVSTYINANIPRLESYTGVKISEEFKDLIQNSDYILSSLEPSAATVLVKKMAPKYAFHFAKLVQQAFFMDGKRLDKLETYLPLLEKMNLDKEVFQEEWMSEDNLKMTYQEFEKARTLANGFPSFLIQEDHKTMTLASGYFDLAKMKSNLNLVLNS